jgi:thymidylate synthase
MFTFETALAEDAWKNILKLIIEHGDELEDEHDLVIRELLNVIMTVQDPANSKPPEGYSSVEKFRRYEKQFLDIGNHVDGINYGKRLREHFGFKLGKNIYSVKVDQVESVLNRLKKCETTRRATLTAFDPSVDQYQEEIPTMIMMDFKIRKNRLYTTAVWRGHDIYKTWIPSFFGLKGLSKYLAENLGIKIGPITVHSVSAYVYKSNFNDVEKIIK